MPRLFSAIDLGPSARERVAAEQHRLAATLDAASLRWVSSEHLHLTLVFIGQVPEDCAGGIVLAMQAAIPQQPFRCELGGFGIFPSHGAPRTLWLGVRTGADAVVRVQQAIAARCQALGVLLEKRPFRPHLTLARWRDGRRSARPRHLGGGDEIVAVVDVNAVTLFQSRLSSKGSTYTVLAQSPLSDPTSRLH